MRRVVVAAAALIVVAALFGARPSDLATADPVRQAALRQLATEQAEVADLALGDVEDLLGTGVREAGRGQAAVLGGSDDPALIMDTAGISFETAAEQAENAQAALADLAWTLHLLDPEAASPTLAYGPAELVDLGARWRATGLPLAAAADLRRAAEATLGALASALAALGRDDPSAALAALADAEASLDVVREFAERGDVSTLPFWITTVEALLAAATDIANAVLAGDPEALAASQAAYEAAAVDAQRADQALAIALGEAAAGITSGPAATSAEALRDVVAARDALAGLSILP
jgi:hypothetical protein